MKQEALKVGKDLRIEQSYEDLEEQFEPDEKFFFDAIIQLNQTNWIIELHCKILSPWILINSKCFF